MVMKKFDVSRENTMSEKPVEGWYQSPDDAKMLRWWDGNQWTDNEKPNTDPAPPTGAPVEAAPKSKDTAEKVTDIIGATGLAAAGVALAADGAIGLGDKRKGFKGLGKFFIIGFSLMLLSFFGFIAGIADSVDGTNRVEAMGTVTNIQTDAYDKCIPTAEFTVNGTTVATKGIEFEKCVWQVGDPIKVAYDEKTNGANAEIGEATDPVNTILGSIAIAIIGLFVAGIGFVKLGVRAGSVAGGFLLFRQGLKLGKKAAE
jgi:hypothetical protein